MRWFREHTRLAVIISVVVVLVVVIVVSFLHLGDSTPLGRQAQGVLTKIQEPFSKAGNAVRDGLSGIFQFRSIVKENKELKEQVADLERKVVKLQLSDQELEQLSSLSEALNYQALSGNTTLVTANVIAIDGSNWFNFFTIDAGKNRGVKVNSTVISGKYLVGRVIEVGDTWSKVVSIVDESNSVSFRTLRDLNQIGILSGSGNGELSGYMLDANAKISEGDLLITSGLGIGDKGMYPPGISIGKVKKVTYDKNSLLKTLTIEPAGNFKNIQIVTLMIPN